MNRAREIIRDGKFAACAFISREEFVILKFLCKYVLTPQTFSYISPKEKYADFHITSKADINIKISHTKDLATYFSNIFFKNNPFEKFVDYISIALNYTTKNKV